MDLGLEKKVTIVTGANGGIGMAMCQAFLLEGATLVPFYRGSREKLNPLFQWAQAQGIPESQIFPVSVDIENTLSIEEAVATVIEEFQAIDVLVNNAGWTVEKPFLTLEDDEWDQIVSINLAAVAKLTRCVMKYMLSEKNGSIVNVSSGVSERYGRGVAAYSAMKAAVNRLTECLALEMGKKGIRVNAVCPGVIDTKMSVPMVQRLEKQIHENTPLQRIGTPEEVAQSVLFLASEKTASFITGSKIFVDGGACM